MEITPSGRPSIIIRQDWISRILTCPAIRTEQVIHQIRSSRMASTQCCECDEEIEVAGRIRLGQKIICNHCGAQLEVVATDPLEIDIAADEDDDLWDDDDDFDDE